MRVGARIGGRVGRGRVGGGVGRSIGDARGVVRRVAPDGVTTIVAGDGKPNGLQLTTPRGLALGPDGSLYIAETFAHRIRRVTPSGVVTVVAGTGTQGFGGDGGLATQALLSQPHGMAVASDGTLYIADTANNRIRRVRTDGFINTLMLAGAALGGAATAAAGRRWRWKSAGKRCCSP